MKVSLEFAHTNLAAVDTTEIERSAHAARNLLYVLRESHDVRSVVLFDDKKIDRKEAESRAADLLQLLSDLDVTPDGFYYERDLMKHLHQLGAVLPKAQRRELERSSRSYIQKYDSLPCSVDIAIWHALRLGALGLDRDIETADVAVSILGDSNEEYERKARQDILDHIEEGSISARVIDLYYPERASASFQVAPMLQTLTTSLKDLEICPAS